MTKIFFPTGMDAIVDGRDVDNLDIPMLVRIRAYNPTDPVGSPVESPGTPIDEFFFTSSGSIVQRI